MSHVEQLGLQVPTTRLWQGVPAAPPQLLTPHIAILPRQWASLESAGQ